MIDDLKRRITILETRVDSLLHSTKNIAIKQDKHEARVSDAMYSLSMVVKSLYELLEYVSSINNAVNALMNMTKKWTIILIIVLIPALIIFGLN